MQWESWSAFWSMGGAAFFVWGSYGLTFALMALELALLFRHQRGTVTGRLGWRRAVGKSSTKKGGAFAPAMESET